MPDRSLSWQTQTGAGAFRVRFSSSKTRCLSRETDMMDYSRWACPVILLVLSAVTAAGAAPPDSRWQKYNESHDKAAPAPANAVEQLNNKPPVSSWEKPLGEHSKVSQYLNSLGENYC